MTGVTDTLPKSLMEAKIDSNLNRVSRISNNRKELSDSIGIGKKFKEKEGNIDSD